MKLKVILVVFLFAIWSVISGWYYVCIIKQSGQDFSSLVGAKVSPIHFKINGSAPVVGHNFDSLKNNLLRRLGENNVLLITGICDSSEVGTTSYRNLGLARALATKYLFRDVNDNRIILASNIGILPIQDGFLDAITFSILLRNEFIEETSTGVILRFNDEDLEENLPTKLEAYLTYLSIEKRRNSMEIIGQTESTAHDKGPNNLGLKAAYAIKKLLIRRGVDSTNLKVLSMGNLEPIIHNPRDSSAVFNNRVEIRIN
jgi:outer membrane protein OmpA-like peptidoglycan-associated protein